MIVYTSEQGTLQWKIDRAGAITASMYSTIRKLVGGLDERQQKYVDAILAGRSQSAALDESGYKAPPKAASVQKALEGEPVGEYSDAAKNYAFRLAVERIAGTALDDSDFETWAMRRGKELEENCRLRHEADINEIVDLASFVATEDRKFGCSADGLVGEEGISEYKCFIAPDKLRPILIEDDWGDIQDQGQGCMWITGRAWVDYCLYCPALEPVGLDFVRKRVHRDDDYIEALEQDLVAFDRYVKQCRQQVIDAAKSKGVLPQEAAAIAERGGETFDKALQEGHAYAQKQTKFPADKENVTPTQQGYTNGMVEYEVTCTFRVSVPSRATAGIVEKQLTDRLQEAGFQILQSVEAHRAGEKQEEAA